MPKKQHKRKMKKEDKYGETKNAVGGEVITDPADHYSRWMIINTC